MVQSLERIRFSINLFIQGGSWSSRVTDFSYFLLDQFPLGGSDFSYFIEVWKKAPIKCFIFCSDTSSTTIKLFQWHRIGVFKIYTNACCISSQHLCVLTTPAIRILEIYFLVGYPGEKQNSEHLWRYKLSSFLTPYAFMMWQNAE